MSDPKTLIADDDEMSVAMLEMMLMQEGINRIDKAYNGTDALEMYEDSLCQTPYRLVFLDINMPGMDGLEVLRRIREAEEDADYRATIIMATGDSASETVISSIMELDADDHIGKPYNKDEIHELLVGCELIDE